MKKASFYLPTLALAAGLMLGGCTASSHIEKADGVSFARYRSFGFAEDSTHARGANEIIDANIRKAITEEMEKKGQK